MKSPRRRPRLEILEDRLAPATYVWDGLGSDNHWSTGKNWLGNVAPTGTAVTMDNLVFPAGPLQISTQNDFPNAVFNSITISGSNYALGGNLLTLGSTSVSGGGFVIVNNSATGDVISLNIKLANANNSRQFFTADTATSFTISGKLSGNTGSELTKDGSGTLILTNNNSLYNGPIDVVAGILQITNANALGSSVTGTAVESNAQLQVNNVVGAINVPLIVNGTGVASDGALLNVNGNNTWAGSIQMDSDTYFGANAGTLTINGIISDLGSGHNLTKVGGGQVYLDPLNTLAGNTYRGTTTVSAGILSIGHPFALGPGGQTATVTSNASQSGTLALNFNTDPSLLIANQYLYFDGFGNPIGFKVPNEILTINGPGQEGIHVAPRNLNTRTVPTAPIVTTTGALSNLAGQNSWEKTVNFWSSANSLVYDPAFYYEPAITIGAAVNTTLTVNGVITDNGIGLSNNYSFSKVGAGRVILTQSNTYTSDIDVLQGFLNIQNSGALGLGASIGKEVWWGASLELQSSQTSPVLVLPVANTIQLNGPGANNEGALRNISGLNKILGTVQLIPNGINPQKVDFVNIDVEPDPDPNNLKGQAWNDFSQLTITGQVQGTYTLEDLHKIGLGELVFTNSNTYLGRTFINQGWITVQNSQALGGTVANVGDTQQPPTVVANGAALVLKQTTTGQNINLFRRIILTGLGLTLANTQRFPFLVQHGALENVDGTNIFSGDIYLNGVVGIGVELDGSVPAPPPTSQLSLTGYVYDYTQPVPANSLPATIGPGGITKLGTQRLVIQAFGTYTGPVDVAAGVLTDANNTGLGAATSTTTVENGAALELQGENPLDNGGMPQSGIEVWGKQLILNGAGNATVVGGTDIDPATGLIDALTNVSDDNLWRGPITLNTDAVVYTGVNSRMSLFGAIDDSTNLAPGGSNLTVRGTGELVLAGSGTYRGTTTIDSGTVTVENGQALGAPGGAVTVANGASLQLERGITIAGKPLTVQGTGAVPGSIPVTWFNVGPSPIDNGQTPGNQPVSGRVTGVAVDPTDPNVIYLAAAGGGAWTTKDGGLTWHPLIDTAINAGGAALSMQDMFTGSIATTSLNPHFIYVGTGEGNNSLDSYYGEGILKSTDSGLHWTLLQGPTGTEFSRKAISQIVVDPFNPNVIYFTVTDASDSNAVFGGTNGVWKYDATQPPARQYTFLTNIASASRIANMVGPGPNDDTATNFLTTDQYQGLAVMADPEAGIVDPAKNVFITFSIGQIDGGFFDNGSFVSIDSGVNWTENSFPMTESIGGVIYPRNGMVKVAMGYTPGTVAPTTPSQFNGSFTLYSATSYISGYPTVALRSDFRDIQKTTITWSTSTLTWSVGGWSTVASLGNPLPNYSGTQAWYDFPITINPTNVNNVFVAGVGGGFTAGPMESTDGGKTWTDIGVGNNGNGPHGDAHAFAWDSNNKLLFGNDGGIWRLDGAAPGSILWTDLNGNLTITEFNSVAPAGNDPGLAFGGSQDNGTEMFGNTQPWNHVDDGDGGQVAINPLNSKILYHVLNGTLQRSTTGGGVGSWSTVLNVGGLYFPFVLDQINPNRLIVANNGSGAAALQESLDGGSTWHTLSVNLPISTVVALAIPEFQGPFNTNDPNFPPSLVPDRGANSYDPNTIYVSDGSSVYVTKDDGTTWALRGSFSSVQQIVVDPVNRDIAFVVQNLFGVPQVSITTDAGQTWNTLGSNLPDLPAWTLAVDPRNGDVYVGNDNGVYRLANGVNNISGSWTRFGVGMPNVQVTDLHLNLTLNTLTAATYGRGMFQLFLDNVPSGPASFRAVSGLNVWTGSVTMVGDTTISAEGPQGMPPGGTAALNIIGTISDATAGADYQLTKIGLGDVILSGANTYGGVTDVQGGNLVVHNANALGGTSVAEVQQFVSTGVAGTFTLTFAGQTTGALPFTVPASGGVGPTASVQNALNALSTIGGLGGSVTVTQAGNTYTVTFLGALDGFDQPQMTASQPWISISTITNGTGGTIIEAIPGSPATLELQSDLLDQEAIQLNGNGVPFNGHNVGSLYNVSNFNSFNGTIVLNTDSTIGVASGTALTVTSTGTILGPGRSLTKEGTGELILAGDDNYGFGNAVLNSTTVNAGILNIQNGTALGAAGSGNTTEVLDAAQLQTQGNFVVPGQRLVLSGAGIFGSGAMLDVGGNNEWEGPVVLAQDPYLILPNLTPATTPPAFVLFNVANAGDSLTIDGQISPLSGLAAPMAVDKIGPGTLVFQQADTYTGGTNILTGWLTIEDSQALGAARPATTVNVTNGAALQLEANVVDGHADSVTGTPNLNVIATVNLNGTGPTNNGGMENVGGSNIWSGAVVLQSDSSIGVDVAASPLSINKNNGGVQDPSPAPVPPADLTKVGAGTLVFLNADTYAGNTFVNQGALNIQDPKSLGGKNATTTVAAGASLQLQNNINVTTENLVLNGPGLNNAGALENAGGTNTWTSSLLLASNSSIGVDNKVDTLIIPVAISDGGLGLSVTEVGPGTLDYKAANTYSGLTQINQGTLLLDNATGQALNGNLTIGIPAGPGNAVARWTSFSNEVPSSSTVTVNSNGLLNLNGKHDTVQNLVIVEGKATTGTLGTGILTVSTLLNMTGGTFSIGSTGDQLVLGGNVIAAADPAGQAVISGPGTVSLGGSTHQVTVIPSTYSVSFQSPGGQPTLSVDGSGLMGTNPTASVVTTIPGSLPGTAALQTITFGGTVVGGTFTLTFNGVPTQLIPWSGNAGILASNIQNALNQVVPPQVAPGISNTDVITFPVASPPLLIADGTNLSPPSPVTVTPSGNTETLSFTPSVAGGSFTLTVGSRTPLPVQFSSDPATLAANIQGALNQLFGVSVTPTANNAPNTSDLDIQSVITGNGSAGLTKAGGGRLQLDAINLYPGLTTINSGEVEVDGVLAGTVALAGGVLSGNGNAPTVDGEPPVGAAANGFINPGDNGAPFPSGPGGVLNAQTVILGPTTTLFLDLNNAVNGVGPKGYDQLDLTGNVDLNGAVLTGSVGNNVAIGDSFTVLTTTGGTISGKFAEPFLPDTVYFGLAKFQVIYNPTSVVLQRQLNNVTMTVSSSVNPVTYGQDFSFTALVKPEPGAGAIPAGDSVTFTLSGGGLGSPIVERIPLVPSGSSDLATFDPQFFQNVTLQPGAYTLTAKYNGDSFFNTNTQVLSPQTINLDKTNISLSANPAAPVFGQPVTISVAVTPVTVPLTPGNLLPTGGVNFTIDGVAYVNNPVTISAAGQASIVLSTLTSNLHLIDATYVGDTNYASVSTASHLSVTVQKDAPAITVSSNPATTTLGQIVTFTVTVAAAAPGSGTPTGTVSFTDGINGPVLGGGTLTTVAGNGIATISISSLAVGVHPIVATYSGDVNFTGGANNAASPPNNPLSFNVGKGASSATVTPSVAAAYGQAVTFTATISAVAPAAVTPTGTVKFMIDGSQQGSAQALFGSGIATLAISSLSAGNHIVTAVYNGDGNLAGVTSPALSYTVAKATTKTTVSSAGSVVYGQPATLTANITAVLPGAGVPTGSVTFSIDGVSQSPVAVLANGQATFVANGLTVSSTHQITASYAGDGNFAVSDDTASPYTQVVIQASTVTTVTSSGSSVTGQPVTITAAVTVVSPGAGAPSGTVTFVIDGVSQTSSPQSVVGGLATFVQPGLSAGTHTLSAIYSGDGNFFGSTATAINQSVAKDGTATVVSASGTSVFGQPVTFTATVTSAAPGSGTPTGSVTFSVDGAALSPAATVSAGIATFVDSALTVGSHNITANYGADSNYNSSNDNSTPFVQVVSKSGSSAAVSSAGATVFGQPISLIATISPTAPGGGVPGGSVTFVIDGVNQTPTMLLSGGQATYVASGLSVGNHSISVNYAGDVSFLASSNITLPYTQTVNRAVTKTALSSSGAVVFGQPATFTATISAVAPGAGTPTGSVTFAVDGVNLTPVPTLNGGVASFIDSSLTVGTHSITASYAGDGSFLPSDDTATPVSQTVGQDGTKTAVSSSGTTVFGQTATFTATITAAVPGSGTPTGSVTFVLDGVHQNPPASLSGGIATFVTSALTVGGHSISAIYNGDVNFFPSSNTATPLTQTVNQASSKTTVTTSPNPSGTNQPVTFAATISAAAPGSGTPTGSVTFVVDGATQSPVATLSGGQAVFVDSALTVGLHQITALYAGDTNFLGSNNTAAPAVQAVGKGASTTTVTSAGASTYGQAVTFTAAVSGVGGGAGTPSGTVSFAIDGVVQSPAGILNGGQATFIANLLPAGSHQITATYSGDANFFASDNTASPFTQTVGQAGSRTVVSAAGTIIFGQTVTFTATVSPVAPGIGSPTGSVTFFVDGASQSPAANLSAGLATFAVGALTAGTHQITAVYGGDNNFFSSSNTATPLSQSVTQASSKTTVTSSGTVVFGQAVTFTATISAMAPGSGTPTGAVTFAVDGVNQAPASTLAGGKAVFVDSNLTVGTHNITAIYGGDLNFAGSDDKTAPFAQSVIKAATSTSISSSGATVFGQLVTFAATITATPPGAGTPTGTVTFVFDGAAQSPAATVTSGVATFAAASLTAGNHQISAVYSGDTNFSSSNDSATPFSQSVGQAGTTTTLAPSTNPAGSGQVVTFTASVAAAGLGAGTPTGTVTFNIDGVNQSPAAIVNGAGIATFTTNSLSITTHSIVATYNGDLNFTGSGSATLAETILNASSTALTSSASSGSVYGQGVTFTASVSAVAPASGTPSGSITFVIDGVTQSPAVNLVSGSATLSTSGLTAGSHSISANYSGDASFALSSASFTQTVSRDGTQTTVTPVPSSAVFGTAVTLTANVTAQAPGNGTPTGTVTFNIDGVNQTPPAVLSGGQATITLGSLSAKTHTIIATYNDDSSFAGSSSGSQSYTVTQANTSTAVTASGPTVYGQAVTLTAAVSTTAAGAGIPAGTVQFIVDNANQSLPATVDVSGRATLVLSNLNGGAHTIQANFLGSTNFTTSSGNLGYTVGQDGTTAAVSSSGSPSAFGQNVTFTAAIANISASTTPTGNVQFVVDGANQGLPVLLNGTGQAAITISNLPVGPHTVAVTYAGNGNFAASSNTGTPVNQTVNQAITSTTVSATPSPSSPGKAVTFTALVTTLAPGVGVPTGTVILTISGGSVNINQPVTLTATGRATFSTSSLPAGTYNVSAAYQGSTNFAASSSSVFAEKVAVATTTRLASSRNPATAGQSITYTATVSTTAASGTITFMVDGAAIAVVNVFNGKATFSTNALAVGSHRIQAIYSGDASFNGSSSVLTQTVYRSVGRRL